MKYFAAIGLVVSVLLGAVILLKRDAGRDCHEPMPPAQTLVKSFSKFETSWEKFSILIHGNGDLFVTGEGEQKFRLSEAEVARVLAAINVANYMALESDGKYSYTYDSDAECKEIRIKKGLDHIRAEELQKCSSEWSHSSAVLFLLDGKIHRVTDRGCASSRYRTFRKAVLEIVARHGVPQAQMAMCYGSFAGECVTWIRVLANHGYKDAQMSLGDAYSEEPQKDLVLAYFWFTVANTQSSPYRLNELGRKMTPAQVAEAERLADEWKPLSPNAAR